MRILGIDPGTATTGWGVVESRGSSVDCVSWGVVTTPAGQAMEERLETIFTDLKTLIKKYRPQAAAVENLFFNTNAKTALLVGQARGVVILACRLEGISVFSYTPLQIKMGITGYGRAEKQQMQAMVQKLLKLDKKPRPDDAADALAAALTHAFSTKLASL